MRVNWNFGRLAMLLAFFAAAGAGCSGINAGTTVSPASFFLPGLLRNDAPCMTNSIPVVQPNEFASAK
jgi:hypothetical protein